MQNNKQALFFINSPKGGGAEKACLILAKTLYAQNINSVFVTTYYEDFDWPEYIDHYCLDLNNPFDNFSKNEKWNDFLDKYRNTQFELISAHLPMSWKVALKSQWTDKCVYVIHNNLTIRNVTTLYISHFIKKHLRNKKLGFVSEGLKHWFIEKYQTDKNKAFTLYNPIEINKSCKEKPVCNGKYILCIGRLCEQKNQKTAIKIYAKLRSKNDFKLVFVGKGKDEKKLAKICKNNGIEDNVIFVDYLENPYRAINDASLVISTSKYEGFNMVIAESIACKTPVISSDCDFGPNEILVSESSNYLYQIDTKGNPLDVQSVINLIDQILQNPSSYVFANTDKFIPENITSKYLDAYKSNH